jgi:glycosyltransferase involved in cell wall biosynthesis
MGAPSNPAVPQVSVVIPTYNRCEDCKRAVSSVLAQEPPPLEVLVCDDGSSDGTQVEFLRWQESEPRLRYLRIEPNRGTPGPVRNEGAKAARGDWVAFLDDDDRWLPGKLAAQLPFIGAEDVDVIAGDAIRSNGERYFGANGGPRFPSRAEVERDNPVIVSSSLVRRSMLMRVGGFDERPEIAGVADYELWLRLADEDASFAILDMPLIEYADAGTDHMSASTLRMQFSLLRVRFRRWLKSPTDRRLLISLLREAYFTGVLTARRRPIRLRTLQSEA